MFRNHPFRFLLCLLLVPLFGLGIILLLAWWINCRAVTLIVTDCRTILRRGIFSRSSSEVLHAHVRNIRIDQTFLERICRVGTLGISSAAQADVELQIVGVPDPYGIQALVDRHRGLGAARNDACPLPSPTEGDVRVRPGRPERDQV
jgi:uncharacterized membrane protein YdbT with pleckstrin-like domain